MNPYIGNPNQLYGVEEYRLTGGKGDGMRFYQVRNGNGLSLTISLDRAADLSRVEWEGVNFGYFAPCGYVAPAYFDREEANFLKSFTAGFLTTCGLSNVGEPCEDEGEKFPLHGTVSHIPAESAAWWIRDGVIHVKAVMRDGEAFGKELILEREYQIPVFGNTVVMTDTVRNEGVSATPLQMLYHCNVGYPLLDEDTELSIPSVSVTPRNEHAAEGMADWQKCEKPQAGYEEMCFYHEMHGEAAVKVYQPKCKRGFEMKYDTEKLPCFTQWKMMGERDYVLGVEPGNAFPDGRNVMREKGMLNEIAPGEERSHSITFTFLK